MDIYGNDNRASRVTHVTTKCLMYETGGFKEMFARSYQANINDMDIIDDFAEITRDGQLLDPISMAGISSRILQPQVVAGDKIDIDNGFAERRLVFMMEVESYNQHSRYPKVTVLSGYTDISDFTYDGSINPDTRFYINSLTSVNASGGSHKPVEISHLISSKVYESRGRARDRRVSDRGVVMMRPTDIITDISNAHSDIPIIGTTNHINENRVMKSRRRNGVMSRYLSDIMSPVMNADPSIGTHSVHNFNLMSKYDQAAARIKESDMASDPLSREFRRFAEFTRHGYMTWDDLCDIIDRLDERTTISRQSDRVFSQGRNNDVETWGGADNETITATMVNQTLAAIMATCMVTYLEAEFSNETIDGLPAIKITDIASFSDIRSDREQAQIITGVIRDELMPIITGNNQFEVSVSVQFDLLTESFIQVSFEGGTWTPYRAPVFCDALYSPVITHDENVMGDISRTVGALISEIN